MGDPLLPRQPRALDHNRLQPARRRILVPPGPRRLSAAMAADNARTARSLLDAGIDNGFDRYAATVLSADPTAGALALADLEEQVRSRDPALADAVASRVRALQDAAARRSAPPSRGPDDGTRPLPAQTSPVPFPGPDDGTRARPGGTAIPVPKLKPQPPVRTPTPKPIPPETKRAPEKEGEDEAKAPPAQSPGPDDGTRGGPPPAAAATANEGTRSGRSSPVVRPGTDATTPSSNPYEVAALEEDAVDSVRNARPDRVVPPSSDSSSASTQAGTSESQNFAFAPADRQALQAAFQAIDAARTTPNDELENSLARTLGFLDAEAREEIMGLARRANAAATGVGILGESHAVDTDLHDTWQRLVEDRRNFAAFTQRTGLPVRPDGDGGVVFGGGNGREGFVLPYSIAADIVRAGANVDERIAFLARWANGEIPDGQLDAETKRVLFRRHGRESAVWGSADYSGIEAFREIVGDLEAGEGTRDTLIAAASAKLFPELDEYATLKALILDALPGIGNARSAVDAVHDFAAIYEAVKQGDFDAAAEAGLLAVLDTAGAIPGLGNAFKPIARATVAYLKKSTKLGEQAISAYLLRRGYREGGKHGRGIGLFGLLDEEFKLANPELMAKLRDQEAALKGSIGEYHHRRNLEHVGFDPKKMALNQKINLGPDPRHWFAPDVQILPRDENAIPLIASLIEPEVLKLPKGKRGLHEVKVNASTLTPAQRRSKHHIQDARANGQELPYRDLDVFRYWILGIPDDDIREALKEGLSELVKVNILTTTERDAFAEAMTKAIRRAANEPSKSDLAVGEIFTLLARLQSALLEEQS